MTRVELEDAVKNALGDLLTATPCVNCGGNPFANRMHIETASYYIFELVKRWKEDRGQIDIDKAVKKAWKATDRHFRDKSTEELAEMLGVKLEPEESPASGDASGGLPLAASVDPDVVGSDVTPVEPVGTTEEVPASELLSDSLEPLPSEPGEVGDVRADPVGDVSEEGGVESPVRPSLTTESSEVG